MDPGLERLEGEVELDEAYVGGLEKNKHSKEKLRENWLQGKQIVIGFRARGDGGRIVVRPIPASLQMIVEDEILFTVEEGSTIYSDESSTYNNLERWYQHCTVNHQRGEYVREQITTNGIESVWAIVKRAHKGIYHSLSQKHGHRYYNEITYRLVEGNVRIPMMVRKKCLARKTFKTRLTYKELTHRDREVPDI